MADALLHCRYLYLYTRFSDKFRVYTRLSSTICFVKASFVINSGPLRRKRSFSIVWKGLGKRARTMVKNVRDRVESPVKTIIIEFHAIGCFSRYALMPITGGTITEIESSYQTVLKHSAAVHGTGSANLYSLKKISDIWNVLSIFGMCSQSSQETTNEFFGSRHAGSRRSSASLKVSWNLHR